MLTRWGTCNSKEKRIWINLQMVEKPLECLEYIILHELTHLKVSNHGKDFIENMDKYMPDWKDRKNLLNEQILDCYRNKITLVYKLWEHLSRKSKLPFPKQHQRNLIKIILMQFHRLNRNLNGIFLRVTINTGRNQRKSNCLKAFFFCKI